MRTLPACVAFALLAASGPVAPQAEKPAAPAAEERPASPPAPGRRLNLKLDLPASTYTRDASPEGAAGKDAAGNLPSLGGSAVPYERPPTPSLDSNSPFPKDLNPGR